MPSGTARVALRAVWRLLRLAIHVLRGLRLVIWHFPRLDLGERQAVIGRWSAGVLAVLGISLESEGGPPPPGALIVANHVSWLDIPVIHAVVPGAHFVSKAAIGRWPLVSRLADAAGTLYLERERKRDALRVVGLIAAALGAGRMVAVFPEGTTSDGHELLPFHANLLQASIAAGAPVQPVALRYADAHAEVSAATEFVGRTTLLRSLWRVASNERLTAHLHLLPARPTAGAERRELARSLNAEIGDFLGQTRLSATTSGR